MRKPSTKLPLLAKRYGVTLRTVSNWREQGAPLDKPAALDAWVESLRSTTAVTAKGSTSRDELRHAQAERLKLQSEILKLHKARLNGEAEDAARTMARKVIAEEMLPLKTALTTLPIRLAGRCNPTDPELARMELEHAVNEILKPR